MPVEDKERITVTLPTPLLARVKATANYDKRPISTQVSVLLEEALDARLDLKRKAKRA